MYFLFSNQKEISLSDEIGGIYKTHFAAQYFCLKQIPMPVQLHNKGED